MDEDVIVEVSEDYISIYCGVCFWTDSKGLMIFEEGYRVAGEVWRVHKTDPDPLPSRPHAHCIDGARRPKFPGIALPLPV